jgi:putative transcriptional regulator
MTVRWRRFVVTVKKEAKSRILKAVSETTADLRRLGFIDKKKQRGIKELVLKPIPQYAGQQIRALRQRVNVSQTVLASLLNTSASTVRKWEIGEKQPSGPSLKLLNLLDRKGLDAVL